MQRVTVLLVFAIALLAGSTFNTGSQSTIVAGAALLQATPSPTPPADICQAAPVPWQDAVIVNPYAAAAAVVLPRDSKDSGQNLYLTTWTVPPGTCVPYEAPGNMKDGAIILIVQEGTIIFTAEAYGSGTQAKVYWGHDSDVSGHLLGWHTPQTLNSGDWVTIDDQVWFTFSNSGDKNAVVIKAVWALPPIDVGCAGGCK